MISTTIQKFRCEDKLALKRQNRFANAGGAASNPSQAFGLCSDGKLGTGGYRPPSSSATYNSNGFPMTIRSRFQRKQPATVVRASHSNSNKQSSNGLNVKKQ